MPTVSIEHTARYRYPRAAAFGEHRLLVLGADLEITPKLVTLRRLRIRHVALETARSCLPAKEPQRC